MEFKEQIQRILENVPKVYEAGRSSIKNEVSNALKGSASGEAVALKDVSPLEHNLGVRVESKNIIPFPYSEQLSSSGGVNFVYNADGTITITGTPTEYVMIHLIGKAWPETPDAVGAYLEDGETYTLSMTGVNGEELLPVCMIIGKNKSDGTAMYIDANKPFTVDKSVYRYDVLRIYINSPLFGKEFNCTIAIQLEKRKATPYTPYIADTSGVKLKVQGANIFKYTRHWSSTCTYENGVVTQLITDTATILRFMVKNGAYKNLGEGDVITSTGRFSIPFVCNKEEQNIYIALNGSQADTAIIFYDVNLPVGTYVFSANLTNMTQGSISWKDMQIALVDTDYEPYKEPIEYAQGEDIKSIAPCTTIMTDTEGAVVEVEYNRDLNKAFEELMNLILSLGGNVYD